MEREETKKETGERRQKERWRGVEQNWRNKSEKRKKSRERVEMTGGMRMKERTK